MEGYKVMPKYNSRCLKEGESMIEVSVIIPLLNEEKNIKNLINTIKRQDFPHNKMEIIFVDGNSTDHTVDLIKEFMKDTDIAFEILENCERKTPISMNIGIKKAVGKYIIRFDGHTLYNEKYISLCLFYSKKTNADNVGCLIKNQGHGIVGKAIAAVLSSKFGVGNSDFRTSSKSGYVDTVPFGCFKKDLFNRIGYFDESLLRSEDNEFNARIIKNGGNIFLFDEIENEYIPRDSIKSLLKMGYNNGKEIIVTGITHPGTIRIRHLVPFLFFCSILIGILLGMFSPLFKYCFILELILYLILDFYFTFMFRKRSTLISKIVEFLIYPLFHFFYGLGSCIGLIFYIFKKGVE